MLPENIVSGKSIFGINGTAKKQPTINITNNSNANTCGAGIDQNGTLTIWATSGTSSYEHISFKASDLGGIGTAERGWDITGFVNGTATDVPYACTITGVTGYNTLNIELGHGGANSSYDYYIVTVTIVGS